MLASQTLGSSVTKMIERTLTFMREDARCFDEYCRKYVNHRQSNPDLFLLFDPSEDGPNGRLDDESDKNVSDGPGSDDGLNLGEEIGDLNFGTVDDTDGDLLAMKRGSSLDKRKGMEKADKAGDVRPKATRRKTEQTISPQMCGVSGGSSSSSSSSSSSRSEKS
jgi:hypothetical protein